MKKLIILLCLFFFSLKLQASNDTIWICDEVQLLKVTENAYIHISYMHNDDATVPCNGMVLINGNKAYLLDTPHLDSTTQILCNYLKDSMHLEIVGFITTDWHRDSMGGIAVLNKLGVNTIAHNMTIEIAKSKNLELPRVGFTDSISIDFNGKIIQCAYLGAAHTKDGILIYYPSENILFAGCLIKELKSKDLGYTGDGDLKAYPETLRRIKAKYGKVKYVIPGHGTHGGNELIDYNIKVAKALND